jgi:hypothetical protein
MTAGDAARLADRLAHHGASQSFAEQIALVQSECVVASRLIRAMLRHVNNSDVFTLPPEPRSTAPDQS